MIYPGICSIAFRAASPAEVIRLAADAGLHGIEWGGDSHVPIKQEALAKAVGHATRDSGLTVASYGSYYRIDGEHTAASFEPVLATASALGTDLVRVWIGRDDAERTSTDEWQWTVIAARSAAAMAAEHGMRLACEWHAGTLLSTNASARRFLQDADVPSLLTHWQPPHFQDDEYCLAGLRAIVPRLAHLHVFHWWPSLHDRHPLSVGTPRWRRFFVEARNAPGDRFALLEWARDPAALKSDAAALRKLLREIPN